MMGSLYGVDCDGFCHGNGGHQKAAPAPAADLFSLPPQPPREVRQTSRDAKASVEPRAPNLRSRIWAVLDRQGPKTPDEVAAVLGESVLSVRPQFTLLTKENRIEDTGERRRNESQREAMVWRALPREQWRDAPEHLTAQERIERLKARVSYLEMLLTKEGVEYE